MATIYQVATLAGVSRAGWPAASAGLAASMLLPFTQLSRGCAPPRVVASRGLLGPHDGRTTAPRRRPPLVRSRGLERRCFL
jgi:hypothetical protein